MIIADIPLTDLKKMDVSQLLSSIDLNEDELKQRGGEFTVLSLCWNVV